MRLLRIATMTGSQSQVDKDGRTRHVFRHVFGHFYRQRNIDVCIDACVQACVLA